MSARRLKVLRIITRLNTGGPAVHATLLVERLDARRFESRLLAGVEGTGEGSYLELHGRALSGLVRVPGLTRELRGPGELGVLARLVRAVREFRPDIVHTHLAKAGALGRLAAFLTRVPVVLHTYHGHVFEGYFSRRRTAAYVAVERWLARRTTRLLAVSGHVRDDLLGYGIGTPEQMGVVPLGLDLEPFLAAERLQGELRAELGGGPHEPLIGIVARLVPIKRHADFLRAFAGILASRPAARAVIVGDGELRPGLEALAAELGLRDRVVFLGWRRDLARIYADLDVVVLCSANEGSPVALIEAMAAGRPVVATRVGGVPDVVVDGVTGRLVPPGDPAALSRAVLDVLASPESGRQLGQAGRLRAHPMFGAPRLVADVEELYAALAAKARAA